MRYACQRKEILILLGTFRIPKGKRWLGLNEKQERFGDLLKRAVVTTLAVLAVLMGLRFGGITSAEPDAPIQMVEEIALAAT